MSKRKFQLGDVCMWNKAIEASSVVGVTEMRYFAIVVDYKQDGTGRGRYRVVRTLHPISGATFGEPVWVDPQVLLPLPWLLPRKTAVRVYKANEKLEYRGCSCSCCIHINQTGG